MALSRVKTWSAETLTAADLNAEFNNILNNAVSLVTPFGGNFTFSPDATYDIGASGATRPRDLFLSRNATIGGTLSLGGNVVSDLLFTDASYDIGKAGATRPRDGFFSRNLTAGGTLSVAGNYGSAFTGNANGSGVSYSVVDIRNANTTKDANTVALGLGLTGASDMSGAYYVNFFDADGATTGSISAASGTTVAFNTSSDARLKEDVQPFTGALDILAKVQPRTFTWKKDGHRDRGFIAQELQPVYPYAVTGDPNDPLPRMGVDYGKLTPLLVAAVQELEAKFNQYVETHP
jgi:hypothetical protein